MMHFTHLHNLLLAICLCLTLAPSSASELDRIPRDIMSQRCLECHQGDHAEGDLDLAALLQATAEHLPPKLIPQALTEKWVKVEQAILQKRMPPPAEDALTPEQRAAFQTWFEKRIVLLSGQPHIGPTPLRRLTHYEFLNSLEDLLGVSVRAEYNILSSVNIEKSFVEKVLPVEVPGESGFVNDASALASQPLPLLDYIKCIDFALSKIKRDESSLNQLFGFSQVPDELSAAQVTDIAKAFLRRALRGRITEQHVTRAVTAYTTAVAQSETFPALKSMLRTILLYPEFFYRLETHQGQTIPYTVSEPELATRLAYFLTCSTPDDILLDLADSGQLSQPDVLEQQIARLLNQPRRISLSERFAAQWIGFEDLVSDSDNAELGVPTINRAQYDELLYFFDELFRSDRSLLDVIDSDWVYVSKYNSKTYGQGQLKPRPPLEATYQDVLAHRRLSGPQRRGIENIYDPPTLHSVQGDRYGGIITSAAVMRITSAPERTSPVRRGVWLLDKMMGKPLEAPKNVPTIESVSRSLPSKNPSKLEIIQAHTEKASCQVCHQDIDPLGFGLENFDQNGRWRTQYRNKQEVFSQGTLPGGKSFSSPKQLKQQLTEIYGEAIVRNFIRRLLSYAIGRSLQPCDRVTVEKIYQRAVASDYRSGVVIREIINSPQFLCRQDRN